MVWRLNDGWHISSPSFAEYQWRKKKKIPKTTNQQPIDHDKDGMQIIRKKKNKYRHWHNYIMIFVFLHSVWHFGCNHSQTLKSGTSLHITSNFFYLIRQPNDSEEEHNAEKIFVLIICSRLRFGVITLFVCHRSE